MESGLYAQCTSGNPQSCIALDIWIESTMNKGLKLKSGWLSIFNLLAALQLAWSLFFHIYGLAVTLFFDIHISRVEK